jgi:hypothetical protein
MFDGNLDGDELSFRRRDFHLDLLGLGGRGDFASVLG